MPQPRRLAAKAALLVASTAGLVALGSGLAGAETLEPADSQVEGAAPQPSGLSLPQVAEGVDTQTAQDLVDGLSRGTDLVHDIDLSDPISFSGGSAAPPKPEGMVEHPTFTDLDWFEALPLVS